MEPKITMGGPCVSCSVVNQFGSMPNDLFMIPYTINNKEKLSYNNKCCEEKT
jgi:hypothetical protein